jgi:hypothetical protein
VPNGSSLRTVAWVPVAPKSTVSAAGALLRTLPSSNSRVEKVWSPSAPSKIPVQSRPLAFSSF